MGTMFSSPQPLFFSLQPNQRLRIGSNVLVHVFRVGATVGRRSRTHHHLLVVSSRSRGNIEFEAEQQRRRALHSLTIAEARSEGELQAAARLRVKSFYTPDRTVYAFEDHQRFLSEREYEAMKERILPKTGSTRSACINATHPSLEVVTECDDLHAQCKFSRDGGDQIVVGTLDLNQTIAMADQLTGNLPEGDAAHCTRAYLCNVCVAKELHRQGIAYALIEHSKKIAKKWGITDLYVHVAVDNEAAKKLYYKCGFVYENEEPAWRARFTGRPRELLLWTSLS